MAYDFPAAPVDGQAYSPAGGPDYVWSASTGAWLIKTSGSNSAFVAKAGDVMTGPLTMVLGANVPTPAAADRSLKVATTEYVDRVIMIPSGVDLNTIIETGKYHCQYTNTNANGPPATIVNGTTSQWYIEVLEYDGLPGYLMQRATSLLADALQWQRVKNNNVWGAWRLGNSSIYLQPTINLNNVIMPGTYIADNTATNTPVASLYWYVTVETFTDGTNHVKQTATRIDADQTYIRRKYGGVWAAWQFVIMGEYANSAFVATFANQGLNAAKREAARQNIAAAPFDAMAFNGMQFNGSADINQTGTYSANSGAMALDGWTMNRAGTNAVNCGQNPNFWFVGYANFVYINVGTAQPALGVNDYVMVDHRIEGYRMSRLNWGTAYAQPMTIGFWSGHGIGGIYTGTIRNNAGTRCYAFTYNHANANVPQWNVVTIPGCTDGVWEWGNKVGVMIVFAMAAGTALIAPAANAWLTTNYVAGPGQINGVATTSGYLRITGLIVLPGTEAPASDRAYMTQRTFTDELALCQRYYEKSYEYGQVFGASAIYAGMEMKYDIGTSNSQLINRTNFKVRKRTGPTVSVFSPASGAFNKVIDLSGYTDLSCTVDNYCETMFRCYATVPSIGMGYHWTADCRL